MPQPCKNDFAAIREYGLLRNIEVAENEHAFVFSFTRASLSFKVTVAHSALEWWVEIADEEAGLEWQDWCDDVGYDERQGVELVKEMTEHLHRLMAALLSGEFRLEKRATWLPWSRPNDRCEWLVDGRWVEFLVCET